MVGFGDGGLYRADVPLARPEVGSRATGWALIMPTSGRSYAVYGIDRDSQSACLIGKVNR
jgi:hypothetical protein